MADLRLSVAFGDYDRTRPLAAGRVATQGIELDVHVQHPTVTLFKMLRDNAFDAGELSLGALVTLTARGESPFVGLPVMFHKSLRHDGIFVRSGAGIDKPADLRGKRVGVVQYGGTAVVWMRGMLQHDYGVLPSELSWHMGGQISPASPNMTPLHLPPDIHFEYLAKGETLEGMIEKGELDAIFAMTTPNLFLDGSGKMKRLFRDHRPVELDYHQRTGIFPIAHVLAMKRAVYEDAPWSAASLYRAFCESRDRALEGVWRPTALTDSEPFSPSLVEETRRMGGEDSWSYGVEANRTSLEAMCRFVAEQGLADRVVDLDEIFVPVDA